MVNFFRSQVLKRVETYTKRLINTHNPTVIAVTGSVGKTSTKLAIAHILRTRYHVLVHEGNYNTEFGLPMSLFELEPPEKSTSVLAWWRILRTMRRRIKQDYPYDVIVLEMGADQPGDITRFMEYIQPEIGVVTAVAKVHLEAFGSIEAIAEEKWSLAQGSNTVVYNHDDKRLRERAANTTNKIGYGLQRTDVWSELQEFNYSEGWRGVVHTGSGDAETTFPVIGQQTVYALTAATAVGLQCGVSLDEAVAKISEWKQPKGRMRLLPGKNGSFIIDDSYNSNPYAAVAALDALYQFQGRKIAILGSMNELGEYETAGHRLVGRHCNQLDVLVTIGVPANKHIIAAALETGVEEFRVHECNTPYEAGEYVASLVREGDIILVKGSQSGVFAEESIKSFLADDQDTALLVRQSEQWLAKKRAHFSQ